MNTISKNEMKTFDKVTEHAPIKQLLMWALWEVFNRKKSNVLNDAIRSGMSWRFAYQKAKETK